MPSTKKTKTRQTRKRRTQKKRTTGKSKSRWFLVVTSWKKQFKKWQKKWKLTKKRKKRLKLAGLILVFLLGVSLMLGGGFYYLYRQTILSFKVVPVYHSGGQDRLETPTRISVTTGESEISLPVESAQIQGGIWETSDTAATHLATSARPGEPSNIVIYGHNRPELFQPLHDVAEGDVITVTTGQGKQHHYKIFGIQVVTPDTIDVVLPTEHEELTVYTCTGWLDSKRLIIKAKPVSVNYEATESTK